MADRRTSREILDSSPNPERQLLVEILDSLHRQEDHLAGIKSNSEPRVVTVAPPSPVAEEKKPVTEERKPQIITKPLRK